MPLVQNALSVTAETTTYWSKNNINLIRVKVAFQAVLLHNNNAILLTNQIPAFKHAVV